MKKYRGYAIVHSQIGMENWNTILKIVRSIHQKQQKDKKKNTIHDVLKSHERKKLKTS